MPDVTEKNVPLLHLHTPSQSIAGHVFEMHILVSVEEEQGTKIYDRVTMK